jgi:hypothetical protein
MDAIAAIFAFLGVLVLIDVAAIRFGADTRAGFEDERR